MASLYSSRLSVREYLVVNSEREPCVVDSVEANKDIKPNQGDFRNQSFVVGRAESVKTPDC